MNQLIESLFISQIWEIYELALGFSDFVFVFYSST